MLALGVGAAVLALGSYLFIYALGFGFIGAPIALVVCYWSLVAFTLAYIWLRGLHRNTWYGWSRAALHGWGIYLRLGLPGMLMLMYVATHGGTRRLRGPPDAGAGLTRSRRAGRGTAGTSGARSRASPSPPASWATWSWPRRAS